MRISLFQNTCKPEGIGGNIIVNMMNTGHSSKAEWGFAHIEIRDNYICLDIGYGGGANVKKLKCTVPCLTTKPLPDRGRILSDAIISEWYQSSGYKLLPHTSTHRSSSEEEEHP